MISKILILSFIISSFSFNLPFTRRSFLSSTLYSQNVIFSNDPFKIPEITFNITKIKQLNKKKSLKIKKNTPDPYSHWSFFGKVPPPIKKLLSYQQLLEQIHNNTIFTIQIAPQHDSIIATDFQGYRYACQVRDKDFDKLIQDSLDENNYLPFIVLPIDENRQKLRNLAQLIFFPSLTFYILADLDIIDYDTNSYGSWKERELAYKQGKKPTKFLKSLLDKFTQKNNTNSSLL